MKFLGYMPKYIINLFLPIIDDVNLFLKPGHQLLYSLDVYLPLSHLSQFYSFRKSLSAQNLIRFSEIMIIREYQEVRGVELVIHNIPSKYHE